MGKSTVARAIVIVLSVIAQWLFYGYVFAFVAMRVALILEASGKSMRSAETGAGIVVLACAGLLIATIVLHARGLLRTVRSILLMTVAVIVAAAVSTFLLA